MLPVETKSGRIFNTYGQVSRLRVSNEQITLTLSEIQ